MDQRVQPAFRWSEFSRSAQGSDCAYVGTCSTWYIQIEARRSRCNLHHEDVGRFVPKSVDRVVIIPKEAIEVDFVSQPI